jgi:hypothetical protein
MSRTYSTYGAQMNAYTVSSLKDKIWGVMVESHVGKFLCS